ncbi:MAG: LptF/LptG family permease [Bacteroidota bacterium]
MTTFDRHIILRFSIASVFLIALLIVFFVVLDYVEYIDDFIDRGATQKQVFGTYYLNYIPEIVKLTSPLALFLATIYTTARLSQSLQLAAMTMAGVSLYRILAPFMLVGLLVTGFMLWFNGYVVPRANVTVLDFQEQYYKSAPEGAEVTELYRQNAPGSLLMVGFYDRARSRGFRVSLQDFEEGDDGTRIVRRLDATEALWNDSLGVWTLQGATRRTFHPDGSESRSFVQALDTALTVQPRDLARTERDAERLTIPEARAYLAALERAGAQKTGRPEVGYYTKFAYPFANLILVVLGVPLASVRRRGGQAAQMTLGLGVAFVYLALQKVIEPFGYSENLPPALAAWLAHLLFAGVAISLLLRVRK